MLAHEIKNEEEAHGRVIAYYEMRGLDIPHSSSLEYREMFYAELAKIGEEK